MTYPNVSHQELPPSSSGIKFRAAHLDIPINPLNPPPPTSPSFANILHRTATAWHEFETAEHRITTIVDTLDTEMLDYVTTHQRATAQHLQVHRDRISIPRYEAAISEIEGCCEDLEGRIIALKDGAKRESETVEGRAALQLDIPVMRRCLSTTREMIGVARAQLRCARVRLRASRGME